MREVELKRELATARKLVDATHDEYRAQRNSRKPSPKAEREWRSALRAAQKLTAAMELLKTRTSLDTCWHFYKKWEEDVLEEGETQADKRTALDDPRVARALFRSVCQPKFYRQRCEIEVPVDGLVTLGDVRLITPMREWLESASPFPQSSESVRPKLEECLAKLEATAAQLRPMSAEVAELLARIEPHLGASPSEEPRAKAAPAPRNVTKNAAQVLDSVYAAPDDLDLRRVVGDQLLALGDLRGELIALSFGVADRTAPKDAEKRIKALLHKNAGLWAGPLGPIGKHEKVEFEHGFVSTVVLEKSSLGLTREMWDDALDAVQWATVRTLVLTETTPDWWIEAWLRSPRSQNLRKLEVRDRGEKTSRIVLGRAPGAPGSPLRLERATRDHKKLAKVLRAFDRPQLELLKTDAQEKEAPAAIRAAIDLALAKLAVPAPKKRARASVP